MGSKRSFSELFTKNPNQIYFNSGTQSLTPLSVLHAQKRYLEQYEQNPTAELISAIKKIWTVQKNLGAFLNADPKDLLLRHNVTEALNDFIQGVELPQKSEILVSSQEYGAIKNQAKFRALSSAQDQISFRVFDFACQRSTEDVLRCIEQALAPNTSLLILSHVMTSSGFCLPIAEIAQLTRQKNILLAVDGAHSMGALDLNFSNLHDVDFYGANLHKWFMGPKGCGFGWIPKRNREKIRPLVAGWASFSQEDIYQDFADQDLFTTQHLLKGCRDFSGFFALQDTLDFWNEHGANNIRDQLFFFQKNTLLEVQRATQSKNGFQPISHLHEKNRGPLLSFELPEKFQNLSYNLAEKIWKDYKIQLASPVLEQNGKRKTVLRLSPHIYNTNEELNRVLELLNQIL